MEGGHVNSYLTAARGVAPPLNFNQLDLHATRFALSQRNAITPDEEFNRVSQRGETEQLDLLTIGESHFEQTDGNSIVAGDIENPCPLVF